MLIIQPKQSTDIDQAKQDADIIEYLAKYIICTIEHREVFNIHGEFVNKKSPGFPIVDVDGTTLYGQMYSMSIFTSHTQDHQKLGTEILLSIQKLIKLHNIKLLSSHKLMEKNAFTQRFAPYSSKALQSVIYSNSDGTIDMAFVRDTSQAKASRRQKYAEEYDFTVSFLPISKYDFKGQFIYPNVNGVFYDSDLILSVVGNPKAQLEHTDDQLTAYKTQLLENKMLKMYSQIVFTEEITLHNFWNFIDLEINPAINTKKRAGNKIIEMSINEHRVFRYPADIKKCTEFASFIKPNCFICAAKLYGECYFMTELYYDYGKHDTEDAKSEKAKLANKPKFAYRGFSVCKVCVHSSDTPRRAFHKSNFCIIYDTEIKLLDTLDSLKCSAEKLKVIRELYTAFENKSTIKSICDEKNYIVTPSFVLVPDLIESLATVKPDANRKIIKYTAL